MYPAFLRPECLTSSIEENSNQVPVSQCCLYPPWLACGCPDVVGTPTLLGPGYHGQWSVEKGGGVPPHLQGQRRTPFGPCCLATATQGFSLEPFQALPRDAKDCAWHLLHAGHLLSCGHSQHLLIVFLMGCSLDSLALGTKCD